MPTPPPSGPSASDPRKQKQKGSGFTNLNKVIDANKGNQLGSAVAGGMEQTGQKIQQATTNAADRFNQDLKQNAFGQEQAAQRDAIIGKAASGDVNDQDVAAISRFSSGAYQGPTTLQDKDKLSQDANRAGQIAQGANTQTGRYGLLQQFNPSAKYTQGTKRTDALLLGQDAGKLQQSGQALRSLSRGVGQQIQSAEGAAQEATALNKSFGADTRNTLDTGMTGITSAAEGAQKTAQEKELAKTNAAASFSSALAAPDQKGLDNNAIRKNTIKSSAAQLGLSEDDANYMSQQYDALVGSGLSGPEAGAQISKIMNRQGPGQDVLSDVSSFMSPEKAAQLKAFQKLSGKEVGSYDKAGQYKESTTDLKDKSSIEGLSRARNDQTQLKAEADRLQHYVTHSKDAKANALSGRSKGDREFFASYAPELKDIYSQLDAGTETRINPFTKKEEKIPLSSAKRSALLSKATYAQNAALEKAKGTIDSSTKKSEAYGNLNSVDSYKEYLNKLGKVGTF